MTMQELIIYSFAIAEVILVPTYILFRNRMEKNNLKPSLTYSKRRILRLLLINFAINSLITLWSVFMLANLHRLNFFSTIEGTLLFILYAVAVLCTYYGNGMYIASITIEAYFWYSKPNPDLHGFKALKHFHGPISHLIAHTGWLTALLALAGLDGLSGGQPNLNWGPLVVAGICAGIGHGVSQIYSKTWKYQFITGFLCLISFFIIFQSMDFSVRKTAYGSFYAGAIITYCLVLALWPMAKRATRALRFIVGVFDWRE